MSCRHENKWDFFSTYIRSHDLHTHVLRFMEQWESQKSALDQRRKRQVSLGKVLWSHSVKRNARRRSRNPRCQLSFFILDILCTHSTMKFLKESHIYVFLGSICWKLPHSNFMLLGLQWFATAKIDAHNGKVINMEVLTIFRQFRTYLKVCHNQTFFAAVFLIFCSGRSL